MTAITAEPTATTEPPTESQSTSPIVDREFAKPASRASFERAADALRAKGYDVHVAPDRETAKRMILEMIPEGAEVSQGTSKTLEELGVTEAVETSGRYEALRLKLRAMDRKTQGREIRKLGAAPDFWLNSVQALTEDGVLVNVSNTGSQIGPIAAGAGRLILAIGSQKIVPDLETALRRVEEYNFPLEDARLMAGYGMHTGISKVLITHRDVRQGRVSIVLIREAVGE